MGFSDLERLLEDFDKEFWKHLPGEETIDHTEDHVAKLVGKLATVSEEHGHGSNPDLTILDTEVIPDLLIHGLRLARDRGIDPVWAVTERLNGLRAKFNS